MNNRSRNQLYNANLSKLAMAMALPHENKPTRFPLVPVVPTAMVDTMANATFDVSRTERTKAALCRDPVFPLWGDRMCSGFGVFMRANTNLSVASTGHLPILSKLGWDLLTAKASVAFPGQAKIDFTTVTADQIVDQMAVLGQHSGDIAIYVPKGAALVFQVYMLTATVMTGSLAATLSFYQRGEWVDTTVTLTPFTETIVATPSNLVYNGFKFAVATGTTSPINGVVLDGSGANVYEGSQFPGGFYKISALRTYLPTTILTNPVIEFGWTPSYTLAASLLDPDISSPIPCFSPWFSPPEFKVSVIPYRRTRANATAALFTNVSKVLNMEGTITAARLNPASVDMWNFDNDNLSAVHPSFRYFGPMEKGLYTFTTPTGEEQLSDRTITFKNAGSRHGTEFPLFGMDTGVYNAIVFNDADTGTTSAMATSQYVHLEFETVSSLFSPGVSNATLETLHAAEVALVQFGHFHENPLHWGAIATAAKKALAVVAPMVAPYIQQAGTYALNKGVSYLTGKAAGDRTMAQRTLTTPRPKAAKTRVKKVTPRKKNGKK